MRSWHFVAAAAASAFATHLHSATFFQTPPPDVCLNSSPGAVVARLSEVYVSHYPDISLLHREKVGKKLGTNATLSEGNFCNGGHI